MPRHFSQKMVWWGRAKYNVINCPLQLHQIISLKMNPIELRREQKEKMPPAATQSTMTKEERMQICSRSFSFNSSECQLFFSPELWFRSKSIWIHPSSANLQIWIHPRVQIETGPVADMQMGEGMHSKGRWTFQNEHKKYNSSTGYNFKYKNTDKMTDQKTDFGEH